MIYSDNHQKWESCNLCGYEELREFYPDLSIVQCKGCGFVFYGVIPTRAEIDEIYSGYSREAYITELSRKKIYFQLEEILRLLNINSVIDIACGECYILNILRDINPSLSLFGTEHEAAQQNVIDNGFGLIKGGFFPETKDIFDLIIFSEAIEHINDFNQFLERANNLLISGGGLYITTPNFNSLERYILKERWGMIAPPEHLAYFSNKTLDLLLSKHGFQKVFLRTENISIFRIVEFLTRHYKNSPQKSPQELSDAFQSMSSKSLPLRFAKKSINSILGFTNLGSSIKALYKKI